MRLIIGIQKSGLAMLDQLRQAANVRCNDWTSNQLGFTDRIGRIVNQGGMDKKRRFPKLRNDLRGVNFPDEVDVYLLVPQPGTRFRRCKINRHRGNAPLKVQSE